MNFLRGPESLLGRRYLNAFIF